MEGSIQSNIFPPTFSNAGWTNYAIRLGRERADGEKIVKNVNPTYVGYLLTPRHDSRFLRGIKNIKLHGVHGPYLIVYQRAYNELSNTTQKTNWILEQFPDIICKNHNKILTVKTRQEVGNYGCIFLKVNVVPRIWGS